MNGNLNFLRVKAFELDFQNQSSNFNMNAYAIVRKFNYTIEEFCWKKFMKKAMGVTNVESLMKHYLDYFL